ncbi:MAG: hypothetical protein IK002_06070 [Treponema sp.]|uniref:hypothetical protein n=1 Tax=Treponema sp. TaxID=166 RepID=UPI00298D8450|nr:hypothetical protein [Treponema sp.]MBR5933539.1 hypothetical protein [Treponema sp.]
MTANDGLDRLLSAFERYYTVNRENLHGPFDAEAEFRSQNEKYVLIKSAQIGRVDSNEYVYFSVKQNLDFFLASELSKIAWETGLKKVQPYNGHKNSDIVLVIIADSFSEGFERQARKIKFSKSYKLGLFGYSNFRFAAVSMSDKKVAVNFHGRDLKKMIIKNGIID